MMGKATVSEIHERILEAFSKQGLNAVETLEAEIARLQKAAEDREGAIRALLILRDALAKPFKKKARRSNVPRKRNEPFVTESTSR